MSTIYPRVTVPLPPQILELIDHYASETGVTRGDAIATLVAESFNLAVPDKPSKPRGNPDFYKQAPNYKKKTLLESLNVLTQAAQEQVVEVDALNPLDPLALKKTIKKAVKTKKNEGGKPLSQAQIEARVHSSERLRAMNAAKKAHKQAIACGKLGALMPTNIGGEYAF